MFNPIEGEPTFEDKIRRGNIKARMRMIYIRDIAQRIHGITIDNTNRTEFELGFFTKNDGQDLSPLFELWKTEEYELAKYLLLTMKNEKEKKALQDCIDAVPTDGLGITDSDLEQMGCDSYEEVDDILRTLINAYTPPFGNERLFKIAYDKLIMKYSVMKVDAVWCRHVKSEFKRKGLITLKFNRYIC